MYKTLLLMSLISFHNVWASDNENNKEKTHPFMSGLNAFSALSETLSEIPKDIQILMEKALAGDSEAQNELGALYYEGKFLPRDHSKAFHWYLKAAEEGKNGLAQFMVGLMWENGWKRPNGRLEASPNIKMAISWYKKAAVQGISIAKHNLGVLYFYGRGVEEDPEEAHQLFLEAAQAGVSKSYFPLGMLYDDGWWQKDGTKVNSDPQKALYWYQKAVDEGNIGAHTKLGLLYQRRLGIKNKDDIDKVFTLFLKAATAGDPLACRELGALYGEGWYGFNLTLDKEKSFYWFNKGAELGDEDSQLIVATLYLKGQVVERNPRKSIINLLKGLLATNPPKFR